MGFSGIGIAQLGIILLLVILIFGTKKLRNLGTDIGAGIKGIRDGFSSEDHEASLDDVMDEVSEAGKAFRRSREKFRGAMKDLED